MKKEVVIFLLVLIFGCSSTEEIINKDKLEKVKEVYEDGYTAEGFYKNEKSLGIWSFYYPNGQL